MADNLRVSTGERRLVDQNSVSWNQIASFCGYWTHVSECRHSATARLTRQRTLVAQTSVLRSKSQGCPTGLFVAPTFDHGTPRGVVEALPDHTVEEARR